MKFNYLKLILIIMFLYQSFGYSAPLPTRYDLEQDKKIDKNTEMINTEIDDRKKEDDKLREEINKETDERKVADSKLNDKISNNKTKISNNSTSISNNKKEIKNIDNKHTKWNKEQDLAIKSNKNAINDLDDRVNELEQTQYVVEGNIRIIDSKKWEVKPFARYNIERNKVDTVGIKFTFKIGTSYEERLIEKLEAELEKVKKEIK